uniref:Uncharacterized protein n=1 Tax=Cacopsylla melanoneura TaxID=428564 RepID=A0A8D8M7L8_9HEMI
MCVSRRRFTARRRCQLARQRNVLPVAVRSGRVRGSFAGTRLVRMVGRRPLALGQVRPVAVLAELARASVEADRHVYFEQIRVLKAGKQSVTGRKARPPEYCVHRITE